MAQCQLPHKVMMDKGYVMIYNLPGATEPASERAIRRQPEPAEHHSQLSITASCTGRLVSP
jgi:hypothetical protein